MIAKYSMGIEMALKPSVSRIATVVEAPSIKEMMSGPPSLQSRSTRLMRAFNSVKLQPLALVLPIAS